MSLATGQGSRIRFWLVFVPTISFVVFVPTIVLFLHGVSREQDLAINLHTSFLQVDVSVDHPFTIGSGIVLRNPAEEDACQSLANEVTRKNLSNAMNTGDVGMLEVASGINEDHFGEILLGKAEVSEFPSGKIAVFAAGRCLSFYFAPDEQAQDFGQEIAKLKVGDKTYTIRTGDRLVVPQPPGLLHKNFFLNGVAVFGQPSNDSRFLLYDGHYEFRERLWWQPQADRTVTRTGDISFGDVVKAELMRQSSNAPINPGQNVLVRPIYEEGTGITLAVTTVIHAGSSAGAQRHGARSSLALLIQREVSFGTHSDENDGRLKVTPTILDRVISDSVLVMASIVLGIIIGLAELVSLIRSFIRL